MKNWIPTFRSFNWVTLVLVTGACAMPASRDGMVVPESEVANNSTDQFMSGKISVGNVTSLDKDFFYPGISIEEFEAALINSLRIAQLLSEQPYAPYILDAEIVEVDEGVDGDDSIVRTDIRYVLRESGPDSAMLQEIISATGMEWSSDTFYGQKNLKYAYERSARSNIKKIVDRLHSFDPNDHFDYVPDEERLWQRFEERKKALINNDYQAWLDILPACQVDGAEAEAPQGLRSMFDYYAKDYKALKVTEICDCIEISSPQGNPVVRCRTLTWLKPVIKGDLNKLIDFLDLDEGAPSGFFTLELWQFESGEWYWGYTDHHKVRSCP